VARAFEAATDPLFRLAGLTVAAGRPAARLSAAPWMGPWPGKFHRAR
jgi:hypothetical protein